jgi:hypothetical protein
LCSWPYYLRDLLNFNEVLDCSQSGAGSNHIFNSIVNEIELGAVDLENDLIIVMWSGLTRTDVISITEITKPWQFMSNYNFDSTYSTLSIPNINDGNTDLDKMCNSYKRQVPVDAQVYESVLKMLALRNYLENKNANFIFTSGWDLTKDLELIDSSLTEKVSFDPIMLLGDYTKEHGEFDNTGHPTPDSYLGWAREHLAPYVISKFKELKNVG